MTYASIKTYPVTTNLDAVSKFLLQNAEALAQGEGSGNDLTLWCRRSKYEVYCSYSCKGCGRLVMSTIQTDLVEKVSGSCSRCGTPAN